VRLLDGGEALAELKRGVKHVYARAPASSPRRLPAALRGLLPVDWGCFQ
jgi:hypothetical protein